MNDRNDLWLVIDMPLASQKQWAKLVRVEIDALRYLWNWHVNTDEKTDDEDWVLTKNMAERHWHGTLWMRKAGQDAVGGLPHREVKYGHKVQSFEFNKSLNAWVVMMDEQCELSDGDVIEWEWTESDDQNWNLAGVYLHSDEPVKVPVDTV